MERGNDVTATAIRLQPETLSSSECSTTDINVENLLTVCLKVLTPRGASGTSKQAFIVNRVRIDAPASLEVIWDLPQS